MAIIKCRDWSPGRQYSDGIELSLTSSVCTLADVIRQRVRRELEVQALADPKAKLPSPETAVAAALDAFCAGQLVVLFGDRQITTLAEELTIVGRQELTFLRLVPLASG